MMFTALPEIRLLCILLTAGIVGLVAQACASTSDAELCAAQCDANADCVVRDTVECICSAGFSGDGTSCTAVAFHTVSSGDYHTCGIKVDDTLWCWGQNTEGKLGVGDESDQFGLGDRASPTQESTLGENWRTVVAGQSHTCAIKRDDSLWCWGSNSFGQLGDGNAGDTVTLVDPTEVQPGTKWSNAALGSDHTCGVRDDSTVYCWGKNNSGQLGLGNFTDDGSFTVPTEVSGHEDWILVEAGSAKTLGLKDDRTVWEWGLKSGGSSTVEVNRPQQVGSASDWESLSAHGGGHACGLRTGNTLWCWGSDNQYGQMGTGILLGNTSPVQETTLNSDWLSVDAGHFSTCAIDSANSLWCWGYNNNGNLGTGESGPLTNKSQPTAVLPDRTDWSTVTTGVSHTCGLTFDGELWCWGGNSFGQLGVGTASNSPSLMPVQVLQQ